MASDAVFRVVEARALHETSFIRLEQLTVEAPSARVTRLAVRHPGAVAIIPVHEGRVYLIRQYRAPVARNLLELPAGTLDIEGEPREATAARELEEEIGFRAGRLEHVYDFYTAPGFTDGQVGLYLATELTAVPVSPHGPEEEEAEIVSLALSEIPSLLVSRDIADAKTIIGLQWLADRDLE